MSNVYRPIDLDELRSHVAVAGAYDGERSGYAVAEGDDEHATVFWRNAGSDDEPHEDKAAEIAGFLSNRGYEAKIIKPAGATVAVRAVVPYVKIGSAKERDFSFEKAVSLAEKGPRSLRGAVRRLFR